MSREIMQQALNVLEFNLPIIEDYGSKEQLTDCHKAIIKLYEELAKPEQDCGEAGHTEGRCGNLSCLTKPEQAERQEPVARFNWNEAKFEWLTEYSYDKHHMKPLYLAPPRKEWVGLTQEERDELLNGSTRIPSRLIDWVEQKLKEKNSAL